MEASKSQQKSLKTISLLSSWMDNKFTIPGTNIKFGIDALLSLIPGIGDIASTGISLGIMGLILKKGVPFLVAIKMMFNLIVDAIFSSVPILGTIADVGFKANTRNLKLLETHLENNPKEEYQYGIWLVFVLTIVLLVFFFVLVVALIWKLLAGIML